jgi:hypothetical protein
MLLSKNYLTIREIKKYICLHPELLRFFPLDKTVFHTISWTRHNQSKIGFGTTHEENLLNKRWDITGLLNDPNEQYSAYFYSTVLFHNPTHFVIEYLRFDFQTPHRKKITIIDGRKDTKNWVEEIDENMVNKRVYPKYRPDDSVKY